MYLCLLSLLLATPIILLDNIKWAVFAANTVIVLREVGFDVL